MSDQAFPRTLTAMPDAPYERKSPMRKANARAQAFADAGRWSDAVRAMKIGDEVVIGAGTNYLAVSIARMGFRSHRRVIDDTTWGISKHAKVEPGEAEARLEQAVDILRKIISTSRATPQAQVRRLRLEAEEFMKEVGT